MRFAREVRATGITSAEKQGPSEIITIALSVERSVGLTLFGRFSYSANCKRRGNKKNNNKLINIKLCVNKVSFVSLVE